MQNIAKNTHEEETLLVESCVMGLSIQYSGRGDDVPYPHPGIYSDRKDHRVPKGEYQACQGMFWIKTA